MACEAETAAPEGEMSREEKIAALREELQAAITHKLHRFAEGVRSGPEFQANLWGESSVRLRLMDLGVYEF